MNSSIAGLVACAGSVGFGAVATGPSIESELARHTLAQLQVELFAGSQEVVAPAVVVLAVVDADHGLADDQEAIALDDDRGRLVEPQAEQPGLGLDDFDQIVLAAAGPADAGRWPRPGGSRTLPRNLWPS